jgi:peptidyl-prolyl cis-trans isomerase C
MNRSIPLVVDYGAGTRPVAAQAGTHAHDPVSGRPLPGAAPVLLRVGETEISEAEVAREMQHHRDHDPHRARSEAARALVVRELLRLEVERLQLASEVTPIGAETIEEACIRVLLEREAPTPIPDLAACRRYYDSNRARLRQPDRILVRHILLAAAPDDPAARQRALQEGDRLIAELRAHPERFTEFAQRHSDCPSRDQGGELGWIERGQTTPEFERQIMMLKPGFAGLTVESRWGHHVVCVDAIERGQPLSFEQSAEKIASYLEAQVRQNAIHQYLQILRQRYPVHGLDDLPEEN